jgi:hypothetical protein
VSPRGPVPAESPQRRNKTGARTVTDAPPEFPPLPGAELYLPQTRSWYETWCTSPQASTFAATDWMRLHMLAPLVDAYWQKPSKDLMAEIRQNESKLGATGEDRQRLRMKLEQPKPPETEKPARSASRDRKDPRSK